MARVAIVTGGASGIGLALGAALVRRGWHVVIDDIPAVKATEQAERLTRAGPGSAAAAGVDVRDAEGVIALVNYTHSEHGRLDMMVNNAGISIGGEPDELELLHWDTIIDTNLRGVVHGCHAAYPLMKQQRFGTIVNTASMAGLYPQAGTIAPYAATKYGVVGLSLALRAAGAEYGVHVSALCPGFIDTPSLAGAWPDSLPVPPSMANQKPLSEWLPGWAIYPADKCAEDTLAGLAKNKPILAIPRFWQWFWLLSRLFPSVLLKQAEADTSRARKALLADA